LACVVTDTGAAWARQVSVSGATALSGMQVLESADQLRVSGILQDDARQPVPSVPLQVALPGHSAEVQFFGCGPDPTKPPADSPLESDGEANTALLETDRLGRFCVQLDKVALGSRLTFHFAGTEHLLPSEQTVDLVPKANQVLLNFVASQLRVALDRSPLVIQVDTKTAKPATPRSIALTLWRTDTHSPQQLGEAVTTVTGQAAFFPVNIEQIGDPGLGELRARFEGDELSSAYEVVTKLTKTGTVTLSLQGQVETQQPANFWEFTVLATATPRSAIAGFLEVQRAGQPVVVKPLAENATATVRLESQLLEPGHSVTVSYVPNEPWWRATGPLEVSLPATPRGVAHSAPWWTASLLLVAFFVWRAWQRPVRGRARQSETDTKKNDAQVIVMSDPGPQRVWSGHVLDSDDERPVPNAVLRLSRASFSETQLLAETTTDRSGAFTFVEQEAAGPGVTLSVSAPTHRPLEQRLERPARLVVRLKQRRRALITELVNWAALHQVGSRRAGTDPTPGQIAHSALSEGRDAAGNWAQSIEHAAFGDSLVDEQRDSSLRQRRPDPVRED
jgi:5-hydroxyisourate hydrolase-like protein (transthyretin family)